MSAPAEAATQIVTTQTVELVSEFAILHPDDRARGEAAALAQA